MITQITYFLIEMNKLEKSSPESPAPEPQELSLKKNKSKQLTPISSSKEGGQSPIKIDISYEEDSTYHQNQPQKNPLTISAGT